jgi:hypothetical protein
MNERLKKAQEGCFEILDSLPLDERSKKQGKEMVTRGIEHLDNSFDKDDKDTVIGKIKHFSMWFSKALADIIRKICDANPQVGREMVAGLRLNLEERKVKAKYGDDEFGDILEIEEMLNDRMKVLEEGFMRYDVLKCEMTPLDEKPQPSVPDYPKSLLGLQPNECQYLYDKLTENGHFLPKDTNNAHFHFVFGGGVCPKDFKPLQWKVSKTALTELITLVIDKPSVPRPMKKVARELFVYSNGKPIGDLPNPKKDEYSKDCSSVEAILKGLKSHPL